MLRVPAGTVVVVVGGGAVVVVVGAGAVVVVVGAGAVVVVVGAGAVVVVVGAGAGAVVVGVEDRQPVVDDRWQFAESAEAVSLDGELPVDGTLHAEAAITSPPISIPSRVLLPTLPERLIASSLRRGRKFPPRALPSARRDRRRSRAA